MYFQLNCKNKIHKNKLLRSAKLELRPLNKYYDELFEIAQARLTMQDKNQFNDFLVSKLNQRQELKTLDLLKLILKKQVIINTLMN